LDTRVPNDEVEVDDNGESEGHKGTDARL
jgi:hypothetical protein